MKAAFVIVGFVIISSSAYADDALKNNVCNTGAGRDQVQCDSEKLNTLNAQLTKVYQSALLRRPVTYEWDDRKTRGQLVKSQAAWSAYVEANCVYVGGVEGGNGNWVSAFSLECQIDETKKRIAFLKAVPSEH